MSMYSLLWNITNPKTRDIISGFYFRSFIDINIVALSQSHANDKSEVCKIVDAE